MAKFNTGKLTIIKNGVDEAIAQLDERFPLFTTIRDSKTRESFRTKDPVLVEIKRLVDAYGKFSE